LFQSVKGSIVVALGAVVLLDPYVQMKGIK